MKQTWSSFSEFADISPKLQKFLTSHLILDNEDVDRHALFGLDHTTGSKVSLTRFEECQHQRATKYMSDFEDKEPAAIVSWSGQKLSWRPDSV